MAYSYEWLIAWTAVYIMPVNITGIRSCMLYIIYSSWSRTIIWKRYANPTFRSRDIVCQSLRFTCNNIAMWSLKSLSWRLIMRVLNLLLILATPRAWGLVQLFLGTKLNIKFVFRSWNMRLTFHIKTSLFRLIFQERKQNLIDRIIFHAKFCIRPRNNCAKYQLLWVAVFSSKWKNSMSRRAILRFSTQCNFM